MKVALELTHDEAELLHDLDIYVRHALPREHVMKAWNRMLTDCCYWDGDSKRCRWCNEPANPVHDLIDHDECCVLVKLRQRIAEFVEGGAP